VSASSPLDQRRTLVLAAAALVLLIVGAAVGMLITRAVSGESGTPGAGSVDVGFAQDMRVHHLQAITMAGIERDHTTDAALHSIAFDIESTQIAQSSQMEGWLTVWGQPTLPPAGGGHMAWMSGSTHSHSTTNSAGGVTQMPGMATTEELNRLRSLSGNDLDVLFLQLMLRHHQGALPMAQYAAEHASVGYVRDLASKMVSAQTAEVTLMTNLLAEHGATPLPAPN
jgi:uncharacterized protein (DUF305 family)